MTSTIGLAAVAGVLMMSAMAQIVAPASAAPRQAATVSRLPSTDLSAQRRTRITVRPRRAVLGPNSMRRCRAWLAQEFRPSGTVIVPRQQCWWE